MDVLLLRLLNGHRTRTLDVIVPFVNFWGYYALPLAAIVYALVRRDRLIAKRTRDVVLAWFLGVLLSEDVLKSFIHRARPSAVPGLRGVVHVLGRVPSPTSWSFPSGTAAAVFAASTCIWLGFGTRAGIVATVIAIVVSATRVYVGVHFPSDLLAGAILGVIVAWGVVRLSRWVDAA